MDSHLNADFRKCFSKLPKEAKQAAVKAYKEWKQDPLAPALDYKPIDSKKQIYSVRAGISHGTSYRAFGVRNGDEMTWYWIGTHEKANSLYKNVGNQFVRKFTYFVRYGFTNGVLGYTHPAPGSSGACLARILRD